MSAPEAFTSDLYIKIVCTEKKKKRYSVLKYANSEATSRIYPKFSMMFSLYHSWPKIDI